MYLKVLDGVNGTTAAPRARAFGTIQCVAKAFMADTDYMTIHDGYGARLFEFDVAGDGVTAGRVQVNISGASDAASVGVILAAAINGATHADGTVFAVTARHVGTGLVYVECDNLGTVGNQTMTENVADAGHTVAGLAGAVDGVPLARGAVAGSPAEGFDLGSMDEVLFVARSREGSGTMTFGGRMWGLVRVPAMGGGPQNVSNTLNTPGSTLGGEWVPVGVAPAGGADANRGDLNNAVAVAESYSLSDLLQFGQVLGGPQVMGGLRVFERVYCQVTTLGGTSPVLDAWLRSRD